MCSAVFDRMGRYRVRHSRTPHRSPLWLTMVRASLLMVVISEQEMSREEYDEN
jgi:hypothetical protein